MSGDDYDWDAQFHLYDGGVERLNAKTFYAHCTPPWFFGPQYNTRRWRIIWKLRFFHPIWWKNLKDYG